MAVYLDKEYKLYMDNFYNYISLADNLILHKKYVYGTLRTNRKENPKHIIYIKTKERRSLGTEESSSYL